MARPLALCIGMHATTLGAACPPRGVLASPSHMSQESTSSSNCAPFNSRSSACSCSYSNIPQQQKHHPRRRKKNTGECCAQDGRREFVALGSVSCPSLFGRATSRGFGECQTSSSSSCSSITPSASSRAILPSSPSSSPLEAVSLANSVLFEVEDADHSELERKLLKALQERRTEDAWNLHKTMRRKGDLPSEVCLSRLVAQLSHRGTPHSLSRAQKVLVDLQKIDQVELLDEDSLGILVMASARNGAARYACNILRVMLDMGMCPPVKVWSVVVSRLGKHAYDAPLALKLFDEICSYLQLECTSSRRSGPEDKSEAANGAIVEKETRNLEAKSSGAVKMGLAEKNEDNSPEEEKILRRSSSGDGGMAVNFATRGSRFRKSSWMDVRIDTAAFNAVLNACATLGLVKEADDLLDRMAVAGVKPDRLTFNILIKLSANAQEGDHLHHILREMNEAGVEPDLSTYNSLVAAYVNLGEIDEAERLVKSMQQGGRGAGAGTSYQQLETVTSRKGADNNVSDIPGAPTSGAKGVGMTKVLQEVTRRSSRITQENEIESFASEDGNHREHRQQQQRELKHLWVCKTKPDVRTYTTLMKGYVKSSRLKDAVQLLVAMQNKKDSAIQPNEVTYTTVIGACIDIGMMDEAKSVLVEMTAQRVPANVVTYNVLLKGYCNAGQVATAYEVMEDMRKAGISPDSVSYNTLINGCIRRDDNLGALEVFREMRRANIGPTEISYTALMNAFARNGQYKLVAEVFNEMRTQAWMRLDVIAWNVLIDGYCKAGQMDEAKQAFVEMKAEGFHPSVATYGSLVKGFQTVDKPGEVLVLWKEIKERTEAKRGDGVEPLEPDGGLLDYLVDTCLRAGFFQKALEVVACMEGQGILADKIKYKRMFIDLYSTLYTSKHASARRRAKSAERRSAVDAFKFWLGLPNRYYQSDWDP